MGIPQTGAEACMCRNSAATRLEINMKILAVDDDELIREILSATLEAHGYTDVTLAESGEDALKKMVPDSNAFTVASVILVEVISFTKSLT